MAERKLVFPGASFVCIYSVRAKEKNHLAFCRDSWYSYVFMRHLYPQAHKHFIYKRRLKK